MQGLSEVREAFAEVENRCALEATLGETTRALGFTRYSYYRMRPRLGELDTQLCNYPIGWINHYNYKGYHHIDPIFLESGQTIGPITWASLKTRYAEDRGICGLLNEATDFGLRDGISVPIHGPNNSLDVLSICSPLDPAEVLKETSAAPEACCIMAMFARQALDRLDPAETKMPVHLTPREREVLLWTARGKTAWEIGRILSISDQTVVFHVKNAGRKFGAYSKQHAVVSAILQGLINP